MNISVEKKFFLLLFVCFVIFLQGVFDLPVMDRDEARFATASKTMLHTKDFIDIRMVDEPRYKKPVGIYWLQTFSNYIFQTFKIQLPHVSPPPIAHSAKISFCLIVPLSRELDKARGIDAADVFA